MTQSDQQFRMVRMQKLENLRASGIDPYPHRYKRTHSSSEARLFFEEERDRVGDDVRTSEVSVAGRIVNFRKMGNASFLDLQDGHGKIQALLRRNNLKDTYESIKNLDIGDWLGVQGPIFLTKTGEITVECQQWDILAKSILPLPEKWHGLADVEIRYRQRYLDLISNENARRIAILRSAIVKNLRNLMDNSGFIEVDTPVLVSVPAGGTAEPFTTYYKSLDRNLYLRIATELYLKRLIVGGFEKVYEVGRVFRNEGVDFYHNPEFTMMESYAAFTDYNDVMVMVENLVHDIAVQVLGRSEVEYDGHLIDLTPPWSRLNLHQEVKNRTGIDFLAVSDIEKLRSEMVGAGISVGHQVSWGGLMDKLLSTSVEPHLVQPTFLVDYPVEMSPLAKKKPGDGRLVERFEGFVAGMEIANAFTELNDPVDQRQRLEDQEKLREKFQDEEMDRLDEDFLIAVEHGMPPTGGLGLGVDRLVMLLSGENSIREVVLFPQLRNK